jgi:hypothetical protein
MGAPETGSMAEAVLTPWNNDLESSTRTKTAPLTSVKISEKRRAGKKKRSGSLPLTKKR